MQWVVEEQGVPWEEILFLFVTLGHVHGVRNMEDLDLETEIKWAYTDVCLLASEMGHLKILQYAVEDGCPWVPAICLEAAEKNKHDHVVKWITDNPP